MNDFHAMSWDEANEYARQQPVEDAEFTVEYDDVKSGPAWDVWALTYPHREREARERLTHTATVNRAYWYRDSRDGKTYGLPDIDLVRAENERLIEHEYRADLRHAAVRRVHYAVGMFLFLSLVLLGLAPDVIPWLWVAVPFIVVAYRHALNRRPKERYRTLAPDARFEIFQTDEEIWARRQRILANVLTIGFTVVLLWLFSRD